MQSTSLMLIISLAAIVTVSGCVGGGFDPATIAKANPVIKDFLNDYPNAEVRVTHFTASQAANIIDAVRSDCDNPQIQSQDMFRVNVEDPSSSLSAVAWVDNKGNLICALKKSVAPAPYCGDEICNGNETNATCPEDCEAEGNETEGTCFDSDGGQNYFVYGVIEGVHEGEEFREVDECKSDLELREWYCDETDREHFDIDCGTIGDYVCSDGRCLSTGPGNETNESYCVGNACTIYEGGDVEVELFDAEYTIRLIISQEGNPDNALIEVNGVVDDINEHAWKSISGITVFAEQIEVLPESSFIIIQVFDTGCNEEHCTIIEQEHVLIPDNIGREYRIELLDVLNLSQLTADVDFQYGNQNDANPDLVEGQNYTFINLTITVTEILLTPSLFEFDYVLDVGDNETVCGDGACNDDENNVTCPADCGFCEDTDGGYVPEVQGTISGHYQGDAYNHTDFCTDSSTLTEYTCGANGQPIDSIIDCTGNYTSCSAGACVGEGNQTYECNDGIDNDDDGQTDYPSDSGCSSSQDDDETNCGDGVCEDGETQSTCPADCGSANETDPPQIILTIIPSNVSQGDNVSISANVSDESNLALVTIFVDNETERNCANINNKNVICSVIYDTYNVSFGSHSVLVKAWDIFNNMATEDGSFWIVFG